MDIITHNQEIFNRQTDILDTIDLIGCMVDHHRDEALSLVELARWHQEQAEALAAERRALTADVTSALVEAERLLR